MGLAQRYFAVMRIRRSGYDLSIVNSVHGRVYAGIRRRARPD